MDFEPQRHRGHRDFRHQDLTKQIIGAAIEVHQEIGPGLLESVYEGCLAHELTLRKIPFQSQLEVSVRYKGTQIASDLRADFVVDDKVVLACLSQVDLKKCHFSRSLFCKSLKCNDRIFRQPCSTDFLVALISKHLQPVAKDRLELKAMDAILPVHRAQILTYMRLTGCEIGLLANFNVERLAKGIERFVL